MNLNDQSIFDSEEYKCGIIYPETPADKYKRELKTLDSNISECCAYLSDVSSSIKRITEDHRDFISNEELISLRKAYDDVDSKLDYLCDVVEEIFQNHLKKSEK